MVNYRSWIKMDTFLLLIEEMQLVQKHIGNVESTNGVMANVLLELPLKEMRFLLGLESTTIIKVGKAQLQNYEKKYTE